MLGARLSYEAGRWCQQGKSLSQHEPPHENAADQQHEQHEDGHTGEVEQVLRPPVRGGILPVLLLKLVVLQLP